MIKYGLKLWSTNENWFHEATNLCKDGLIDFVELYMVPSTFKKRGLAILKSIPVQIHAPHSHQDPEQHFNVFELNKEKINLFKNQAIKAADFLNAKYIVLHAGIGDDPEVFKRNIAQIYDKRILIENMAQIGLDGSACFGYSLEQLKFIKNECRFNICLDFAHAIKSAKSQNLNYKNYLKSLISNLNPCYFHISGGNKNNPTDEHKNLWESNFDFKWIKNLLNKLSIKKDIFLVFEVPKTSNNLKNDIKNIDYFKKSPDF